MKFEVSFPGGMRVDAHSRGLTLQTDQPVQVGGSGTAMAPFDVFLASIATCGGLYALRFCEQRGIDPQGLGLTLEPIHDPAGKRIGTIRMELTLPARFPEKYREAIIRAVDQCAVKRHVVDPPRFEVVVASTQVTMV